MCSKFEITTVARAQNNNMYVLALAVIGLGPGILMCVYCELVGSELQYNARAQAARPSTFHPQLCKLLTIFAVVTCCYCVALLMSPPTHNSGR